MQAPSSYQYSSASITLNRVIAVGRYSVIHRSQCGKYAIKIVPKRLRDATDQVDKIKNEIECWKYVTAKSEYAAPLLSYFDYENSFNMISPLYTGHLGYSEKQKLENKHEAIATIIYRVAKCLKELHDAGVMHGDINDENILIEELESGKVVLSDFNSTTSSTHAFAGAHSNTHSNIYYMAPETLHSTTFGYNTDVWSLGVVAFQLLNGGEFPFVNKMIAKDNDDPVFLKPSVDEMIHAYRYKPIQWNQDLISTIPTSAIDLVMNMMSRVPWARFDADAVIRHPYIKEYASMQK